MYVEERYSYFKYKEHYYRHGTIVKFKGEYIQTRTSNPRENPNIKIWPYGEFMTRNDYANTHMFSPSTETHRTAGCGYFNIPQNALDNAIERIVKPIEIEKPQPKPLKKDWEVQGMGTLWAIYICVMLASLIFNQFWALWIVETFYFLNLRYKLLNQ